LAGDKAIVTGFDKRRGVNLNMGNLAMEQNVLTADTKLTYTFLASCTLPEPSLQASQKQPEQQ
jgi:hypothetical protein